jgi:hypothetical protein
MTKQNHCEFDTCAQKCKRKFFRRPDPNNPLNALCVQSGFFKCKADHKHALQNHTDFAYTKRILAHLGHSDHVNKPNCAPTHKELKLFLDESTKRNAGSTSVIHEQDESIKRNAGSTSVIHEQPTQPKHSPFRHSLAEHEPPARGPRHVEDQHVAFAAALATLPPYPTQTKREDTSPSTSTTKKQEKLPQSLRNNGWRLRSPSDTQNLGDVVAWSARKVRKGKQQN